MNAHEKFETMSSELIEKYPKNVPVCTKKGHQRLLDWIHKF